MIEQPHSERECILKNPNSLFIYLLKVNLVGTTNNWLCPIYFTNKLTIKIQRQWCGLSHIYGEHLFFGHPFLRWVRKRKLGQGPDGLIFGAQRVETTKPSQFFGEPGGRWLWQICFKKKKREALTRRNKKKWNGVWMLHVLRGHALVAAPSLLGYTRSEVSRTRTWHNSSAAE